MAPTADIGLIGLAVMGQNLVLNMNDHGYVVSVYNRTPEKTDKFLATTAKDTKILGHHTLPDLISSLKAPRRVMLLVKAGPAVDALISSLLPLLADGDIIIDGGNSHYSDTRRRVKTVEAAGCLYVGCGVSGGEAGARHGPSLMPGGSGAAWDAVQEIFQSVAAKSGGEACCEWVGADAAGHYVKMVHNGIEYGDMQLICEAYSMMQTVLGMSAGECADVFEEWNKGVLDSYLIEITAEILRYKDEDGEALVGKIMDKAMQKGTGRWTVESALEAGVAVTLIAEAVFARTVSSMKEERVEASGVLQGPEGGKVDKDERKMVLTELRDALYASKIVSYAQGYMLLRAADVKYGWGLNYAGIALMWRGGCIIRSRFLGNIRDAFQKESELKNLLLDEFFKEAVHAAQKGWRKSICRAVEWGVAVPTFVTALSFYDGYRSAVLPANLLQAQRDYFGAHTYERVDRKGAFHTDWTGEGGNVTSNAYNA